MRRPAKRAAPLQSFAGSAPVRPQGAGAPGPRPGAVPEGAGYRTLTDSSDLDRDDFLRLPGIAPEEADRIMAMIDELTEDSSAEGSDGGDSSALPPA